MIGLGVCACICILYMCTIAKYRSDFPKLMAYLSAGTDKNFGDMM